MAFKRHPGKAWDFSLLFNWSGVIFQWNSVEPQDGSAVYGIRFLRHGDNQMWWEFRWTDTGNSGRLVYSHGRKGTQKSGWTLQGPLVKFTKEIVGGKAE